MPVVCFRQTGHRMLRRNAPGGMEQMEILIQLLAMLLPAALKRLVYQIIASS